MQSIGTPQGERLSTDIGGSRSKPKSASTEKNTNSPSGFLPKFPIISPEGISFTGNRFHSLLQKLGQRLRPRYLSGVAHKVLLFLVHWHASSRQSLAEVIEAKPRTFGYFWGWQTPKRGLSALLLLHPRLKQASFLDQPSCHIIPRQQRHKGKRSLRITALTNNYGVQDG